MTVTTIEKKQARIPRIFFVYLILLLISLYFNLEMTKEVNQNSSVMNPTFEKYGEENQKAQDKSYREAQESRPEPETGLDHRSDPQLYETISLNGDSTTATVMGLAVGYEIGVYKLFVGSLRYSGFKGNIILGIDRNAPSPVVQYLQSKGVTMVLLERVKCLYRPSPFCVDPFPELKLLDARFPLQLEWLKQCHNCTGPVLTIDIKDVFFQLDPFGPGSPPITGLQVFEERPNHTTQTWIGTRRPLWTCKNISINKPMLCAGSTIGTRVAMLKYLEIMQQEIQVWNNNTICRKEGNDQAIHNYLFYMGKFPFAHAIPNRMGIVNTCGNQGRKMRSAWYRKNGNQPQPFPGANNRTWIGLEYNLTDEYGFFTQYDGTRSRVVHQSDRFGIYFWDLWMAKQPWVTASVD